MSFYIITKQMITFQLIPGWNWIVQAGSRDGRPYPSKCGIRIGWLKWSLEIGPYDRNKHLKLAAQSVDQNRLREVAALAQKAAGYQA